MPKETHKKAEHCYESGCKNPPETKGMCRAYYLVDYRRRSKQGLVTRGLSNKYKGWDENKLKGYAFLNHDRSSCIIHENTIFALTAGTDYKRTPSILTIDNYEQEQTVGNSQ